MWTVTTSGIPGEDGFSVTGDYGLYLDDPNDYTTARWFDTPEEAQAFANELNDLEAPDGP